MVLAYHTSHQFLARWDIQFLGHQLKMFLTHSKTGQFGQGSVITVGCSEDACCPISAMQHYLESCRTPLSRPLFHFRNGIPLTAKKLRAILRFHLKSLGFNGFNPSLFNTHSFWIGAATAAAKAGMSSSTIMELGPLVQCCLPLLRPSLSGPPLPCCSDGKGPLTELLFAHICFLICIPSCVAQNQLTQSLAC